MEYTQPARQDARRNRGAILAAAGRVFAAQGIEAPVAAIAASAGTAVGTVYKHYASKDALIDALVVHRLTQIADQARIAASAPGTAWDALDQFLRQVAAWCVHDAAFAPVVSERANATTAARGAEADMVNAITALIDRAHDAGVLAVDITAADLPAIFAGVRRAAASADPHAPRRHLELILRGLRNA